MVLNISILSEFSKPKLNINIARCKDDMETLKTLAHDQLKI
jgi:hypothetical protein